MSLCGCWVAFLSVTLRSRVKNSYLSRDCASRGTDFLRDSQWDTECWVWLRMSLQVTHSCWLCSLLHDSSPRACQCEFGVCSSSGLWGCGCSLLFYDCRERKLWILSFYFGFKVFIFIYFFLVHYPQVFEPSQRGEISYSLLKCWMCV